MREDPGSTPAEGAARRAATWVGGALLAVGVAMRINNAIRYRTGNGFDAVENFEYIRLLMQSWALPEPDAAWSTAHPPFFYYLAASIWRGLRLVGADAALLVVLPLLASAAGLAVAFVAVAFVRRLAPGDRPRAVLAGGLLVFLPVHLYMAVMIGEELFAALFVSLALLAAAPARGDALAVPPPGRAALVGVLGGLAVLTKMSGALAIAAIATTWLIAAVRERRPASGVLACAALGAAALAVGGWYYVHNLVAYGYVYPQDLAVHATMFEMPPGSRGPLDYLRWPLATFTDPQLLHPDLLHAVWASTYDTVWFDGHRHFLAQSAAVTRMGTAITLLALLPTAAFALGVGRAARRAWRAPGGVDTLLVATVALTLLGYAVFTWGNPWYVTVKGSYLLGLSVPFAVYTSEVLAGWIRGGGGRATAVLVVLGLLLAAIVVTFTIGPVFVKPDGPGLPWRALGA